MLRILIFVLLVFNSYIIAVEGSNIHYGLTFRSHSVNQDVRTSLSLTGGDFFKLPIGTTIDFDLKLDSAALTYGYVFRFVVNSNSSLDFISNSNTNKLNFVLIENKKTLSNLEFNVDPKDKEKWFKIKIQINKHNIICSVDNSVRKIPYSFSDLKKTEIYFGGNEHPIYHTTDVPPITIKDIVLRDVEGKVLKKWSLFKHGINEVYDEIDESRAIVKNGIWEVDRHLKWNKISSVLTNEKNSQITFDSINARVFIGTSDSLIVCDLKNGTIKHSHVKKGSIFKSGGSQLIYDYKNDRLISYSVKHNNFIFYDKIKNEWSSEEIYEGLPPIQQHNRFINYDTDQLVLFGGYGNHEYHAELFFHNLDSGEWKKSNLSSCISPRYLSSSAYLGNNKFLIMGGYGSKSGQQEESPDNFYDLFEVNVLDMSCRKLSQLSMPKEPIAFSNSMVVNKDNYKIYALAYNNAKFNSSAFLLFYDLKNSYQTILGDTISYKFLDTESYCDLFLYKNKILYAIILQQSNNLKYKIDIYALEYPPLNVTDVLQNPVHVRFMKVFVIIGIVLIFSMLFFLYLYYRNKQIRGGKSFVERDSKLNYSSEEMIDAPKKNVSMIKLLGGFQIFDKEGQEITESFTPILKQIFLFILLSSIKDGKRITSENLDESFWFGMDKSSASNNRSVNIRKLRLILEKIGDISISNKNSCWFIVLGSDVICDYEKVITLLKMIKQDKAIAKDKLISVLEIAAEGVLLPDLNTDWADNYKSEYSDLIVDLLTNAANNSDYKDDLPLMLRIVNVLLLHDAIDEEAIRIKCKVLFQMGQKGASKQCYDRFCLDYKRLLNTHPDFSYDDILLT